MTHDENEVRIFRNLISYLQVVSLFPRHGGSYTWKLFLKFSTPLVLFGSQILLGQLGHLYQSSLNKNVGLLIYAFYYLSYMGIYLAVSFLFFMKGEKILEFLKIASKIEDEIQGKYLKTIKEIEEYTKKWLHANWLLIMIVAYESYKNDSFCNDNDPHYICNTIIPLWFPIKSNRRMNQYFALLQIMLSTYFMPISIAALTFYNIHKIVSLRTRYLVELLKKLNFNDERVEKTKSEMLRCVRIHMEIRNLVHEMNESLGYVAAPSQNACNNIMIGLCAYLIIKEQRFVYGLSIIMWSLLQWITCYSGQEVEDANELVRIELYNTNWYQMDPTLRSTFKIFQAQVRSPIGLKVKPLLLLSMDHLTNVIKGAYSILMFLLRI